MIARVWHAWAAPEGADAYERHFRGAVLDELGHLDGCLGATLLRRESGAQTELTTIAWFTSMDVVQQFAGADPERAVVQPAARAVLDRFDDIVTHHEVRASTLRP